MRVDIGDGVRLYFDVDGLGLVPSGAEMADRPTVLLLHGGPGFDHSSYKIGNLGELRDVAQVVMYDHRGQGRSDRRPFDELLLDVWADDVVKFCDALDIQNPIVFGASFGSMVAQRYLGRHPEHPSKVILASTATFDTRGDLQRAQCPVLVMQGVYDPITPFPLGEEVAAHLPTHLVTFERFEASGHGLGRDEPEHLQSAIRSFITRPDVDPPPVSP